MPKLLARPVLLPLPMMLIPTDFAASLDPVEFSGESISMLSAALAPLLCLLCLLGAAAELVRGMLDAAAPGPGVSFGGAAAIGTTPFPPLTPLVPTEEPPAEPWYEVGVLPAVPVEPDIEGGVALSLAILPRPAPGVVV